MAYQPKPPKIKTINRRQPPVLIPPSAGKKNSVPMSQNKTLRPAPVRATIGEQLRLLLKGTFENPQNPDRVIGNRR
jgi:hypothetical protein